MNLEGVSSLLRDTFVVNVLKRAYEPVPDSVLKLAAEGPSWARAVAADTPWFGDTEGLSLELLEKNRPSS